MDTRRHFLTTLAGFLALSACGGPVAQVALGPNGQPLPLLYRIAPGASSGIRARMLDRVNVVRIAAGAVPLRATPRLDTAAQAHARDLSGQDRQGHTGSDGTTPVDRASRAGYRGTVLGETIAETYEPELATLAAWMAQTDARQVITDPDGRDLGFGCFQNDSGKIWWVLVVGDGAGPSGTPR